MDSEGTVRVMTTTESVGDGDGVDVDVDEAEENGKEYGKEQRVGSLPSFSSNPPSPSPTTANANANANANATTNGLVKPESVVVDLGSSPPLVQTAALLSTMSTSKGGPVASTAAAAASSSLSSSSSTPGPGPVPAVEPAIIGLEIPAARIEPSSSSPALPSPPSPAIATAADTAYVTSPYSPTTPATPYSPTTPATPSQRTSQATATAPAPAPAPATPPLATSSTMSTTPTSTKSPLPLPLPLQPQLQSQTRPTVAPKPSRLSVGSTGTGTIASPISPGAGSSAGPSPSPGAGGVGVGAGGRAGGTDTDTGTGTRRLSSAIVLSPLLVSNANTIFSETETVDGIAEAEAEAEPEAGTGPVDGRTDADAEVEANGKRITGTGTVGSAGSAGAEVVVHADAEAENAEAIIPSSERTNSNTKTQNSKMEPPPTKPKNLSLAGIPTPTPTQTTLPTSSHSAIPSPSSSTTSASSAVPPTPPAKPKRLLAAASAAVAVASATAVNQEKANLKEDEAEGDKKELEEDKDGDKEDQDWLLVSSTSARTISASASGSGSGSHSGARSDQTSKKTQQTQQTQQQKMKKEDLGIAPVIDLTDMEMLSDGVLESVGGISGPTISRRSGNGNGNGIGIGRPPPSSLSSSRASSVIGHVVDDQHDVRRRSSSSIDRDRESTTSSSRGFFGRKSIDEGAAARSAPASFVERDGSLQHHRRKSSFSRVLNTFSSAAGSSSSSSMLTSTSNSSPSHSPRPSSSYVSSSHPKSSSPSTSTSAAPPPVAPKPSWLKRTASSSKNLASKSLGLGFAQRRSPSLRKIELMGDLESAPGSSALVGQHQKTPKETTTPPILPPRMRVRTNSAGPSMSIDVSPPTPTSSNVQRRPSIGRSTLALGLIPSRSRSPGPNLSPTAAADQNKSLPPTSSPSFPPPPIRRDQYPRGQQLRHSVDVPRTASFKTPGAVAIDNRAATAAAVGIRQGLNAVNKRFGSWAGDPSGGGAIPAQAKSTLQATPGMIGSAVSSGWSALRASRGGGSISPSMVGGVSSGDKTGGFLDAGDSNQLPPSIIKRSRMVGSIGGEVFGRDPGIAGEMWRVGDFDASDPLDTLLSPTNGAGVGARGKRRRSLPAVAIRSIDFLRVHAPGEEGIFRVSGRSSTVSLMKKQFDSGADLDLLNTGPDASLDPHDVASLYKLYLRELPSNILTPALSSIFDAVLLKHMGMKAQESNFGASRLPLPGTAATPTTMTATTSSTHAVKQSQGDNKVQDGEGDLHSQLKEALDMLPDANWWLLVDFIHLLRLIDASKLTNKMSLQNLLLVFCPTVNLSPGFLKVLVEGFDELFRASAIPSTPSHQQAAEDTAPSIPATLVRKTKTMAEAKADASTDSTNTILSSSSAKFKTPIADKFARTQPIQLSLRDRDSSYTVQH